MLPAKATVFDSSPLSLLRSTSSQSVVRFKRYSRSLPRFQLYQVPPWTESAFPTLYNEACG